MSQAGRKILLDVLDARLPCGDRPAPPEAPFVTLSFAQSLDGSIASRPGRTLRLSNSHSQTFTHDLRARHDAILVGINTVLADDPLLTVRLVDGRDPRPVVVDSNLRLPTTARLLRRWRHDGLIIATTPTACASREARLQAAGARVVRLPADDDGHVNLGALLRYLRQIGVRSLMVEGGGQIITSFLAARLADQLIITLCPVLVGGVRAVNGFSRDVTGSMPGLANVRYHAMEGDLIVSADLEAAGREDHDIGRASETATAGAMVQGIS